MVGTPFPDGAVRWIALLTALATFIESLVVLGRFDPGVAGFQMVQSASWVKSMGLQYLVGVDGISLWMVLLTTFLFPIAILASWKIEKDVRLYMGAMLALETAVLGSFLALDLLLFFVFFEAILVPMYLLIGGWGGERRVYAAVKFFLFTMAGSAFLLVATLVLYSQSVRFLGHGTFDLRQLARSWPVPAVAPRAGCSLAFFVAFAVKVPLFPLHTWLPDARSQAPTAGSVLKRRALLLNARWADPLEPCVFPEAGRYYATAVDPAVIGTYGAWPRFISRSRHRLIVAHCRFRHLGFVVLTLASRPAGHDGRQVQMVNHGLATGALFLLVGMVYERTHTRELAKMGARQ